MCSLFGSPVTLLMSGLVDYHQLNVATQLCWLILLIVRLRATTFQTFRSFQSHWVPCFSPLLMVVSIEEYDDVEYNCGR